MNKKIEKIKAFGNRHVNEKLFVVLFMMIPVFYLLERLVCSVYDSDMYFLIATGREILQNGIPHTNIWTIDSSSSIVIQQWLYDVVLAVVDRFGHAGFSLFVLTEFVVFSVIWVYFFSLKHVSKSLSFFILIMVSMFTQAYLFSTRPQLITMILIMTSCIAIEKFRQTNKYTWLALLPILSCLEMQFHASMWSLHFAIVLAYIVPAFYARFFIKDLEYDSLHKQWKAIGITCVAMFLSLFINPYGADGVFYIIKSFKAHTFDYVAVFEVQSPTFLSTGGAVIIVCCVLFFVSYRMKTVSSTTINITIGFVFLMTMAFRNNTCSIFVAAFVMRDIAVFIGSNNVTINWKKDLNLSTLLFVLFADLIFITNFTGSCYSVFVDNGTISELDIVANAINDDYDESMRIFTGFNTGAYFEYKGFKNIYMDARPELYTSEFTGDKNILADYSTYCIYGYDMRGHIPSVLSSDRVHVGAPVTQDNMHEWLSEYGFDYIIADFLAEPFLSAYLLNCDDYEIIESENIQQYNLYKRIR